MPPGPAARFDYPLEVETNLETGEREPVALAPRRRLPLVAALASSLLPGAGQPLVGHEALTDPEAFRDRAETLDQLCEEPGAWG
jgi:hypothetical protein